MKKYITEFIGSFFYTFIVWMTIPTGFVTGAGMMTRLSIGISFAILVYAGASISGAHYNPAITLAAWVQKRVSSKEGLIYIFFQLLGAVLAALVVVKLLKTEQLPQEASPLQNGIKALISEILGTFLLAFVYLKVITKKLDNSYYGLAIGLTITVMAYSVGTISGGVFNPIIFVSGAIIKWSIWSDFWIYLGCFVGAVIAGFLYNQLKLNSKN
ncbi:MIP/aquaporin family protein [Confluentibacter flavum]|uniref:Porin n=1 Tax=Confluentibacter flavum TaxID=1909700 RepID=A0A2N3HHV4_9FLAO|nr:aquaporin [Confluentibacter flavum]PKQ44549.1 porin [Confluentibacter flavum]